MRVRTTLRGESWVGCGPPRLPFSLPPKSRTVWSALRREGGLTAGPPGPTTLPDFWGSPPEPAWVGQPRTPRRSLLAVPGVGRVLPPTGGGQVPAPGAPRVGSSHSRSRPAGLGSRVPEAAVPVPVPRCRAAAPPRSRSPSAALPRASGSPALPPPRLRPVGAPGSRQADGARRGSARLGSAAGPGSSPASAPRSAPLPLPPPRPPPPGAG